VPERKWGEWSWLELDDAPTIEVDEAVLSRLCNERIATMGAEMAVMLTRHVRRTIDVLRGRIPDD
jgi:hypothetical protein